jgi:hypothetical protein
MAEFIVMIQRDGPDSTIRGSGAATSKCATAAPRTSFADEPDGRAGQHRQRSVTHLAQLIDIAQELKEHGKGIPGSVVVGERRRPGDGRQSAA